MLLRHRKDICDQEHSRYYSDEIFQMVVQNLSPHVIYNANKELIQSITQTVVNYSPISVNIIDYWNKNTDVYAPLLYKPFVPDDVEQEPEPQDQIACFTFWEGDKTIHKGFGNFNDYVTNIPVGQPSGIDPYEHEEPLLDDDGNPILDDDGIPITILVPHAGVFGKCSKYTDDIEEQDDCGFYLNTMIGLQDKLAEIFMHNVYSIAKKAELDYNFRNKMVSILSKIDIDYDILGKINELFTEERYIINGTWVTKKGTAIAMEYSAREAIESGLQPIGVNVPYKWKMTSKDPMTYSVEGSIFPAVFEAFVKPLSHPIGYIYDYKMVCEIELTDYVMAYKREHAEMVIVRTLCWSDYEPCCNFPEEKPTGNEFLVHPYPGRPIDHNETDSEGNPLETFTCVKDSQSVDKGGTYVIGVANGSPEEEAKLWYKLRTDGYEEGLKQEAQRDYPNVLSRIENGIVQNEESDYNNWFYIKYIFENKNYLIKYTKPSSLYTVSEKVIEYWRNGPNYFYCYARWNDGWNADINIIGYSTWTESTLKESFFEVEMKPGGINGSRWFGFEDDPEETKLDYPSLWNQLIPTDWVYYGDVPPGTNPMQECNETIKCNIKFPNRGFGNFNDYVYNIPAGQPSGIDPNYTAGVFGMHPVNHRCITTFEITAEPVEL